ncbi:uncharacterized protein LOC122511390 isoform X2 [Leptopilina heterotoma]|uniref:uncharacterized protein LOC122511390 isoform X2 n=1 Tax=Leptopilina heterotoma TaxID=63436 RepID=UPI001CA892BD|nr:uncharacterized protein LOC122511390 isoform X2 [Leptopilina heterotoma]
MKFSVVIFFAILVNLQFTSSLDDHHFSDVSQPLSSSDHKVLQDCHNDDYRTYLRCLKRHKRHYEISGSSKNCLDNCIVANCTSSKCVHDCYSRCKKKITETYSKVTETEYECAGGKCKELDNSKIPNITTNVNITIGLNSSNCNENNTKSTGNSASENNDGSRDASKVTINNIITNLPNTGSENSNCRCPGCNCFPWSILPQITIGFGPGPIGVGCCYPQPCTCYQPSPKIDCGYCNNPVFRYKCDASCFNPSGPSFQSYNYKQSV